LDLAHGPGVGSGLLPLLPLLTCSRAVSGVGLGPFCYAACLLRSHGEVRDWRAKRALERKIHFRLFDYYHRTKQASFTSLREEDLEARVEEARVHGAQTRVRERVSRKGDALPPNFTTHNSLGTLCSCSSVAVALGRAGNTLTED